MKITTSLLSVINDDDDIYTLELFRWKFDWLKVEIAYEKALIMHWSHIYAPMSQFQTGSDAVKHNIVFLKQCNVRIV